MPSVFEEVLRSLDTLFFLILLQEKNKKTYDKNTFNIYAFKQKVH